MPTTTRAIVKEIIEIKDDIKEYIIIPERYSRFEAGQFLQLAIGAINAYDIWPDSRAFSIASPYNKANKELRIIVKRGTSFTREMVDNLKEGDTVTIRYPLGDFFIEDDTENLVFIAAGTGITPFLSYINSEAMESYKGNVYFFYSTKTSKDLIHYNELIEHKKKNRNFDLKVFITKEVIKNNENFIQNRMRVGDILENVNNIDNSKIYICGPMVFIEDLSSNLKKSGVKNIYSEIWD